MDWLQVSHMEEVLPSWLKTQYFSMLRQIQQFIGQIHIRVLSPSLLPHVLLRQTINKIRAQLNHIPKVTTRRSTMYITRCMVIHLMRATNRRLWRLTFTSRAIRRWGDISNPTSNPNLVRMAKDYPIDNRDAPFTHNCQIKNTLARKNIDNGNQKNLISRQLVKERQTP